MIDCMFKILKKYNIYDFEDYKQDDIYDLEYYSYKTYKKWLLLSFFIFFNLLDKNIINSYGKIKIIKTLRELTRPLTIGLKGAKEFVEHLEDIGFYNRKEENIPTIDYPMHVYELTSFGKNVINEINNCINTKTRNEITALFAKYMLLKTDSINVIIGNSIINEWFNFDNFYDEEKDDIVWRES